MELFHLNWATRGREPLFMEVGARRAAVRTLVRVGGARLWLFGFADDHVHAVVRAPRPDVFTGHVNLALSALPGAPPLQPAHVEPVTQRSHLRRLVPYVLNQSEHHGLGPTPTWEGSCFADLVGARRLEGFDPDAWRTGLPREDMQFVWDAVGIDAIAPADPGGQPLAALVAVAARVVGAPPDLAGRDALVVRARRLAVALARDASYRDAQIADAFGCTRRNVGLLGAAPPSESDASAARLALAIAATPSRTSRAA